MFGVRSNSVKMPGQNDIVNCGVCKKSMRSDNLKRHMKVHKDILNLPDDELKEELQIRHNLQVENDRKRKRVVATAQSLGVSIPDEVRGPMLVGKGDIRESLITLNKIYLQKVALGQEVSNIISEGEIHEECMSQEYKHALELYKHHRKRVNVAEVVLRPWQKETFNLLQHPPNDRTVMWIYDEYGNTGKSWFQNYVEAYYGYNRVFRCDLRIKHKDICNILKKRSLAAVDVFLFNDSRSVIGEGWNMFRILEDIKDGAATASKYDNQIIKFKTPNHVMIFSNKLPEKKHLSADRWQIFKPGDNGLLRI